MGFICIVSVAQTASCISLVMKSVFKSSLHSDELMFDPLVIMEPLYVMGCVCSCQHVSEGPATWGNRALLLMQHRDCMCVRESGESPVQKLACVRWWER